MRFSAAKMYAAKYKLGTVAGVLKRAHKNLGSPIVGRKSKKKTIVGLTDQKLDK